MIPALTAFASLDDGALRESEQARGLALSGDLDGAQALCDEILRAAGSAHAVRLAHVAPADVAAALTAHRDLAPLWLRSAEDGGFYLLWGHFTSAEDAQAAAARIPRALSEGAASVVELKPPLGAPGPEQAPIATAPVPAPPAEPPVAAPAQPPTAPPAQPPPAKPAPSSAATPSQPPPATPTQPPAMAPSQPPPAKPTQPPPAKPTQPPVAEAAPPAAPTLTAAELFQQGNDAVSRADYPAAIAAFQQSLSLDPDNPRTLSNLGTAAYLSGDPIKAESVFRQAITLEPNYARAHLNLGSALYALERLDEAHEEIQRAIDLDPKNMDARHNLAALLVEQRRWSEALRVLDAALAIAPDDERMKRQREQVRGQLDVKLAQPPVEGHGEPTGDTGPESAPSATPEPGAGPCSEATSQTARSRLAAKLLAEGRAAYERQELAAAEVALDRALECDPASTAILNHLGAVHMAGHDYARAESAFRSALSYEPEQFEATVNLALAIFEGGRCEEAVTLLQRAAKKHQESGEAAFQLARVLHRCGRAEEAAVELARAEKLLPADPRVARLKERLAAGLTPP